MEKEQGQISNDMHICMSIGDGIKTIHGNTVSEPILSEVASLVMSDCNRFSLVNTLTNVLGGFSINSGDRAELLVSAFFTWACNQTVLAIPDPQFPGQLSHYFLVTALFQSMFSASAFVSMASDMPSLCPTKAI